MAESDGERVRELTEALGRELYSVLPDGAAAVVFDFSEVGRAGGGRASGYTRDGDRINAELGMKPFRVARELRAAMYRPGVGTWFSAKVTVTAEGSMDADFNYDDEPVWDEGIPDHWFVTDLERFPRDESAQPAWLKNKLSAAQA